MSSDIEEKILDTPVTDEMEHSFLEYALSVIMSRALPDVRDGLKPVHRRILWSMQSMGVRPGTPYKKSARVVGDAMGKYHPHGDSAIYEALVRMAQTWSLNVPMVDGHGNFGSLGGEDPAAAMRYTECRLAPAAMPMVAELNESTVDFRDNYDGTEVEPEVLPAGLPFLLVNGASGIAVGMRTNIPPHNLAEVVAACKLLLDNDDATLDDVMEVLPGPDFPTGGTIVGTEGVRELYETGKGRFYLRATAEVTSLGPRKQGIVITELPYTVGPEKIFDKIKDLLKDKKLDGISLPDTKNLTDRKRGLQLVIGVKTGFDPAAVLEQLYSSTSLEESFSAQTVAIVDGQPKQLGLVELLRHFLAHRVDVVRRRTTHRLDKAEARLHIVEGLLVALDDIDTVVDTIRRSKNTETANTNLRRKLKLTETQAAHILEMPLRRLTSLEVRKLTDEQTELTSRIDELRELLSSDDHLKAQVGAELDQVVERFAVDRRSTLVGADAVPTVDTDDLKIADEPCRVVVTTSGLIGRRSETFRGKHGRHDLIACQVDTTTHATLYAVTSSGRVLPTAVAAIPEVKGRSRGGDLTEFFLVEPGETVVGISTLDPGQAGLALFTAHGMVKRITAEDVGVGSRGGVKPGVSIIGFREDDDRVVAAVDVPGQPDGTTDSQLAVVTSEGQLLRFDADTVRPQGRSGGGVTAVKFKEAGQVLTGAVATDDKTLVTATDGQTAKATSLDEYPSKGRAGQGVRCHRLLKDDTAVIAAAIVAGDPGVVVDTDAEALPDAAHAKRDASGEDVGGDVDAVGELR